MREDDLAEVWARSLADLADMQIEPHQRAWLQLTRPLGLVENTALIAAPNEFVKEQLETRLRALITNALSRELDRSIQLAVTVDPAATAATEPPARRESSQAAAARAAVPAGPRRSRPRRTRRPRRPGPARRRTAPANGGHRDHRPGRRRRAQLLLRRPPGAPLRPRRLRPRRLPADDAGRPRARTSTAAVRRNAAALGLAAPAGGPGTRAGPTGPCHRPGRAPDGPGRAHLNGADDDLDDRRRDRREDRPTARRGRRACRRWPAGAGSASASRRGPRRPG